ncbi:MAG TPA: chemotaxis protein CheB [Niastella sp.]
MCAKKKRPAKAKTPAKKRTVKKATVTPYYTDPLFPVAAIGASAGGIEAISLFLSHLQPDLGIAYVIIQHLSSDHSSILPEILEKRTSMKVHPVKDGMKIAPDNVYVIPPATYITISDGHLVLTQKNKSDKERHVFDYFLQSLAPVYQHKAIAIVLSGVGFDGTLGVQAIKAEGGISFAQDDSALFQSMARNAYESGHIDFILSPEGIANELAALSRQNYAIESPEEEMEVNERSIKKIHALLHNRFGVDFAHYKGTTINRRILRRMALNRLKELEQYIKLLRENPPELELLYRDLLINVTSFFREPSLFVTLNKTIFPALSETIGNDTDLKESVEYTEAIVQTIRDPLVVLNTDLRIRTANKAFYNLFNLQQEINGYYFFELAGGLLDVPALRQQLQETVTRGVGFQDFELTHHFTSRNL